MPREQASALAADFNWIREGLVLVGAGSILAVGLMGGLILAGELERFMSKKGLGRKLIGERTWFVEIRPVWGPKAHAASMGPNKCSGRLTNFLVECCGPVVLPTRPVNGTKHHAFFH